MANTSYSFGISVPQASKDLALYQQRCPGNLAYDSGKKLYVAAAGFHPRFIRLDGGAYLSGLQGAAERLPVPDRRIERVVVCGHPTLSRPVTTLLSRPDVDVTAVVTPGRRRTWTDRSRRRRDLEIHLGECFLALGHSRTAEAHLERALAEARGTQPLPPVKRLTVLTDLARSASRRGAGRRSTCAGSRPRRERTSASSPSTKSRISRPRTSTRS